MKAVRVHAFGGLDEIRLEEIARPTPGEGQVLVRVRAAGVGPWDALVRSGRSGLPQPLPLTLGSDIAGFIEEIGSGVSAFQGGEVDVVIDTIGGEIQERSFATLKPGGVLVSVVAPPNPELAAQHGVQGLFFIVNVTTEALERITELFESGQLKTHVGTVLPLAEARLAHEMLAGKPHPAGKIVLRAHQG